MVTKPSRNQAVKYALENLWEEAYRENKKLLSENPHDIDSLNRVSYALVKLGRFKQAKEYYQKVLKLDKTNPIALKNLKRLENITKSGIATLMQTTTKPDIFIEEAGKTKTLELKNVADRKTLSLLQPGDDVILVIKRSKVFVQMQNKKYIGMLPDSIGMRMITFMNGGNEYLACAKAVSESSVTIFIREIKKMARFKNQPSFLQSPIAYVVGEK